jgi:hypothetical protein
MFTCAKSGNTRSQKARVENTLIADFESLNISNGMDFLKLLSEMFMESFGTENPH